MKAIKQSKEFENADKWIYLSTIRKLRNKKLFKFDLFLFFHFVKIQIR